MTTYIACTGGDFHPGCTGPVSPDDPDNELCHNCLVRLIFHLDQAVTDALAQRMKYWKAKKP